MPLDNDDDSNTVLIIGGTRFIGRHLVDELARNKYDISIFTRGNRELFSGDKQIEHLEGDRTNTNALKRAKRTVSPDIVFDMVAYKPEHVRTATSIFSNVDSYVYVSSGYAYNQVPPVARTSTHDVPLREGVTKLHSYPEDTAEISNASYGEKKAEGDRIVFNAAKNNVHAMSVRPMVVYGPYDHTERFAYWVNRVNNYDRVLVPGGGESLQHLAYVKDVARALRIVAEQGEPGEAYNVADENTFSLAQGLAIISDNLNTDIELVAASERELSVHKLSASDFPLYVPAPTMVSLQKLKSLGWTSTNRTKAVSKTIDAHLETERTGENIGPSREAESAAIQDIIK
ncbi:NAD-dependent epimerase/dehydratase family protein [Halobellus litoreus]|uniref:NAD-dependent epimerase/dehydratase family protein n=1 Tax=Halobellus litoreus TaxID=755310 RepID=A0ABD6DVI1_9EURY|nr:NAD-dependent epimerase/dehydratase family protein [Halobellus litoreus]